MARNWMGMLSGASVLVGSALLVGSLFRISDPERVSWLHYAIGAFLGLVILGLLGILGIFSRVIGLPDTRQNFPPGYLCLFRAGFVCFLVAAIAFVLIAHGFRGVGFPLGIIALASAGGFWLLMWFTLIRATLRKAWK